MIEIRHLARPMSDWRALVSAYPDSEFASGTRSTLPLLDYWRDQSRALESMRSVLEVELGNPRLHFEHQTPVGDGRGKASHTDLMIDTSTAAVAIEAKFTEPQYETVSKWSVSSSQPQPDGEKLSENRSKVLNGWLRMISRSAGVELNAAAVAAIPYQMIHRAAAACRMGREACYVVYHLFGTVEDRSYIDHLDSLASLCGKPRNITFAVLRTPVMPTTHFASVLSPLKTASHPASVIRDALLQAPLYDFAHPVLDRIR